MSVVQDLYEACVAIFRQSFDPVVKRGRLAGGGWAYALWAETPADGAIRLIYCPFRHHLHDFYVFLPGARHGLRVAPHADIVERADNEEAQEACLATIVGAVPYPPIGMRHWYCQDGRPVAIVSYELSEPDDESSAVPEVRVSVAEGVTAPLFLATLTPAAFWRLRWQGQLHPVNSEFLVDFNDGREPRRCSVWCGDGQHLPQPVIYVNAGALFPPAGMQAMLIERARMFIAENAYKPAGYGMPFE